MTLKYIMFDRGEPCIKGLRGEHDCGEVDRAREDWSHEFAKIDTYDHGGLAPGTQFIAVRQP